MVILCTVRGSYSLEVHQLIACFLLLFMSAVQLKVHFIIRQPVRSNGAENQLHARLDHHPVDDLEGLVECLVNIV